MYQKVGVSRFYIRHNKAENQELTECRNWRRVLEKEKAFWKLLTLGKPIYNRENIKIVYVYAV